MGSLILLFTPQIVNPDSGITVGDEVQEEVQQYITAGQAGQKGQVASVDD